MRTRQQSRVLPGQDCSSSFRPHQHWQDRAQGRQCVSQMARSGAGGQRVRPLLQAADPRVQAPAIAKRPCARECPRSRHSTMPTEASGRGGGPGDPISGCTAPQPHSLVVSGRSPCRQRHWPQGTPNPIIDPEEAHADDPLSAQRRGASPARERTDGDGGVPRAGPHAPARPAGGALAALTAGQAGAGEVRGEVAHGLDRELAAAPQSSRKRQV